MASARRFTLTVSRTGPLGSSVPAASCRCSQRDGRATGPHRGRAASDLPRTCSWPSADARGSRCWVRSPTRPARFVRSLRCTIDLVVVDLDRADDRGVALIAAHPGRAPTSASWPRHGMPRRRWSSSRSRPERAASFRPSESRRTWCGVPASARGRARPCPSQSSRRSSIDCGRRAPVAANTSLLATLTGREREILGALADGATTVRARRRARDQSGRRCRPMSKNILASSACTRRSRRSAPHGGPA